MFYWYKETEGSCTSEGERKWRKTSLDHLGFVDALVGDTHNSQPRPCFDPEFVAMMSVVGFASLTAGTALYNRYLSHVQYRAIWRGTQIIFVLLNLLDYVWVSRWNLALGIPDRAFVLGEEVLSPIFARIAAMPMFILAAQLCPPGIEATLFAFTMGLSNFGSKIGSYMGIGLLHVLGGVHAPHFENLRLLVLIRSLTRALPILLIPYLVPRGTPLGDLELPEDDAEGEGSGATTTQPAGAKRVSPGKSTHASQLPPSGNGDPLSIT